MRLRPIGGRRLAAAAVLVLTVAGGGVAYAATTGQNHDSANAATRVASAVAPLASDAPGHLGHPGGSLSASSSYLGVSVDDLRTQLRLGKTLAEVAQATDGKTVDGLVAAMVADAKQKLAAAVSAGKLTQAQADAIGANLTQRITNLVNGVRPSPPAGAGPSVPAPGARGPLHGHRGFGFGGQPWNGATA